MKKLKKDELLKQKTYKLLYELRKEETNEL